MWYSIRTTRKERLNTDVSGAGVYVLHPPTYFRYACTFFSFFFLHIRNATRECKYNRQSCKHRQSTFHYVSLTIDTNISTIRRFEYQRLRYSNKVNWFALILSKELLLLIASQFPDLLFCITMHRINYIIIMQQYLLSRNYILTEIGFFQFALINLELI